MSGLSLETQATALLTNAETKVIDTTTQSELMSDLAFNALEIGALLPQDMPLTQKLEIMSLQWQSEPYSEMLATTPDLTEDIKN